MPCTVLDIFGGTGTTALVANALGRKAVLIEANPSYCRMIQQRIDTELANYKAKCASENAWGDPINQDDDDEMQAGGIAGRNEYVEHHEPGRDTHKTHCRHQDRQ